MPTKPFQFLPTALPGIEAMQADSRFAFGRHMHLQFGLGVIDRGAQKSISGRGTVESLPGDTITVNPGEIHDGKPLGAALLRGLYHRHYWELPVKEGNVILLVPSELDQELDMDALVARAEGLAPRLGYSLQSLIKAIRPAT